MATAFGPKVYESQASVGSELPAADLRSDDLPSPDKATLQGWQRLKGGSVTQLQSLGLALLLSVTILATGACNAKETDQSASVLAYVPPHNSRVLLLIFPTRQSQGKAFNRVFALTEERGLSRQRIVDNDTLASHIAARGLTPDGFVLAHDYRATDLARFFNLAPESAVSLRCEESELLRILLAEGWIVSTAEGQMDAETERAVIALPRDLSHSPGAESHTPPPLASSTLLHELSHGEFFTNEEYRAFVRAFWENRVSKSQKGAFRSFMSQRGYDENNDELAANELQAYLAYTPDARLFDAADIGLTGEQLNKLRQDFFAEMPATTLSFQDQESALVFVRDLEIYLQRDAKRYSMSCKVGK